MDRRTRWLLFGALVVILGLATVGSNFASEQPDGLEKVAQDEGITTEKEHPLADLPFSDYVADGIADPSLATAAAGALGVLVVLLLGVIVFGLPRRRAGRREHRGTGSASRKQR